MNDSSHSLPTVPRWLHGWAVFTVVAALPVLVLGAEVTTKQVGMADKQAVREPWYLLTLPKDQLWARGVGLVIEHGHRTASWLVGIWAIVLAFGLWFGAKGTRVRAVGWVALILVIVQGLLGIFRVWLNVHIGPEMAMIHGLFAQVVFATLVGVAVVTSRTWRQGLPATEHNGIRRLAGLAALAVYGQIVFGALVRHLHEPFAQRAHVLFAFAVVAIVVWLLRSIHEETEDKSVQRVVILLAGLVAVQIALGVEAWLRRFGAGIPVEELPLNAVTDLVRSAHFFVGALLFATTVALNLLLYRPAGVPIASSISMSSKTAAEGGRVAAEIGGAL